MGTGASRTANLAREVRLLGEEMAYIIEHSGARLLVATQELSERTGVSLLPVDLLASEYEHRLAV
jgi:hypothetical protein